jgi:hypothetical protein
MTAFLSLRLATIELTAHHRIRVVPYLVYFFTHLRFVVDIDCSLPRAPAKNTKATTTSPIYGSTILHNLSQPCSPSLRANPRG